MVEMRHVSERIKDILNFPSIGLSIDRNTVSNTKKSLNESYNFQYPISEVVQSLIANSHENLLSRSEYTEIFGRDVIFQAIFNRFDRNEAGHVDVSEIGIGLSVLFEDSVLNKLEFAFSILDDDNDDHLSNRDLWRLFRSLLAPLFTLNSNSVSFKDLDSIAVKIVAEIKASAFGSPKGSSRDQFVEWYYDSDSNFNSWLDLIDLSNWIPDISTTPETSSSSDIATSNEGQISAILSVSPQAVYSAFHAALGDVVIVGRRQFIRLLDYFNILSMSTEESRIALPICIKLFDKLDSDGQGSVELLPLCISLSVLCVGTKSTKLSFAFTVTGREQLQGRLIESDLVIILDSYLQVSVLLHINFCHISVIHSRCCFPPQALSVLSKCDDNFPLDFDPDDCDDIAVQLAAQVCASGARQAGGSVSGKSLISFESFGEWYNGGGYTQAPWLEMINLSKWQALQDLIDEDRLGVGSAASPLQPKRPSMGVVTVGGTWG